MKFSSSIFKTFFLSLCLIANFDLLHAQTAGILPLAETQFLDQNGNPLTSGTVDFYNPGTTTRKTTWKDSGQAVVNTNPVVLDAAGRALIWGNGSYREVVKDRNANLIWDQVTSGVGTASVINSGDGNSVGTVLPWSGFIAPAQYMFAYGQGVPRASYPLLLATLTQKATISCSGGSNVLNGFTDTTQIPIGAAVEASCLLTTGVVVSKTSTTISLNTNANVNLVTVATVFPYGNGDGSTSFNLPDYRGSYLVGRCNMGGVNCSNLTSTYYGIDPNGLNSGGGNQSQTLLTPNLPPYTPSGTVASISSDTNVVHGNFTSILTSGGAGANFYGIATSPTPTVTSVNSNGNLSANAQGGSSTPFSLIPPSKTINYVIKVIPDISLSGLFGVSDISGMQGSISCGAGLTCTGNNINTVAGSTTGVIGFFGGTGITLTGQCATNLTGSCTVSTTAAISLNIQTANYTIQPSDCNKTLQLGTGSTGQFILTLPAVFNTSCPIRVYNGDVYIPGQSDGKIMSGFPSSVFYILFPNQSFDIDVSGGAWVITRASARWPQTSVEIFVANAGSDTANDCMSLAHPCQHISQAGSIVYNIVDNQGSAPTIILNGGDTFHECITFQGQITGYNVGLITSSSGTGISGGATWGNVTGACPGNQLFTSADGAEWQVQNILFTNASGTSGIGGIGTHNTGILDVLNGMNFGPQPGSYNIQSDHNGSIGFSASYTISGGTSWLGFINTGGSTNIGECGSCTTTFAAGPTMTTMYTINGGGSTILLGPTHTYSGSATITNACIVSGPSMLSLASNTVPGTANCAAGASHGGQVF